MRAKFCRTTDKLKSAQFLCSFPFSHTASAAADRRTRSFRSNDKKNAGRFLCHVGSDCAVWIEFGMCLSRDRKFGKLVIKSGYGITKIMEASDTYRLALLQTARLYSFFVMGVWVSVLALVCHCNARLTLTHRFLLHSSEMRENDDRLGYTHCEWSGRGDDMWENRNHENILLSCFHSLYGCEIQTQNPIRNHIKCIWCGR